MQTQRRLGDLNFLWPEAAEAEAAEEAVVDAGPTIAAMLVFC